MSVTRKEVEAWLNESQRMDAEAAKVRKWPRVLRALLDAWTKGERLTAELAERTRELEKAREGERNWQGLYDNMAALATSNHVTIAELRTAVEDRRAELAKSEAIVAALTKALTFCAREFEPYSKCGYCTSPGGKHEPWCMILVAQQALSSPPIAAMARLLEAGRAYWVAGGKLRANMSDAETFEARRRLTLAQLDLHDAMQDAWGEGG